MTTQEVANRYFELVQKGENKKVIDEMYSENIVSIEPENFSEVPLIVKGKEEYHQKEMKFYQIVEQMHGGYCNEPIVMGDFFICIMGMDVTMKGKQRKMKHEIGVFEVENGKIIKEQFFYKDSN